MKTFFALLFMVFTTLSFAKAPIRVINGDAQYPEGPVWYQGKLYYVDYGRNTVSTWDGSRNANFAYQKGCGQSAVVPTAGGDFLTTCADNNTIGRMSAAGKQLPPYTHDKDGNPFIGPNDFAADAHGGIYFTASGNSNSFAASGNHDPAAIVEGKIFYISADGVISQKAADLHGANGLVVSNDGTTLYLAETDLHRVQQFTISADGTLVDQQTFVNLDQFIGHKDRIYRDSHIWPDGVKIDSRGNIYIGQSPQAADAPLPGVIFVFDAHAQLLRTLTLPSLQVPNLAFSPDEKTVYVTAVDKFDKPPYRGKVYSISNP